MSRQGRKDGEDVFSHASCLIPHALPMVIADLTHAYHATSGGIRTYIDAKRRYLLEHTDHAHVLIVPAETSGIERGERWTTVTIASPVIPFAPPYRALVRPSRMRRALERTRPDVVEVHSPYAEPWTAFGYRRRHPATITSGYYHTDLSGAYIGQTVAKGVGARGGAFAERRAEAYVRALYSRCDLRLAPTPDQAARLEALGVPDVRALPHGVDLETFNPTRADPAAIRARFGVPAEALLLVYAGRLDAEKQTDVLVATTREVNRTRPAMLLLAGEGPERERLEAAQAAGAPVRVLPFLGTDDLASVLASADVYVTAGPHETFALSVVEAQASGLPVVGVAAGALTERVLPSTGRLGPVGDAAAMADNVLAVAEARGTMGRAARAHAEASFSWTATFERLVGLYEATLGSVGGRQ